jgi:hypothetical protein
LYVWIDEPSDKEENVTFAANGVGPSPVTEKTNALQSSSRKVLSQIDTNINRKPLEGLTSTGQPCPDFFEPITPKRPFIDTSPNKLQILGTPLDKFNAESSNLKVD